MVTTEDSHFSLCLTKHQLLCWRNCQLPTYLTWGRKGSSPSSVQSIVKVDSVSGCCNEHYSLCLQASRGSNINSCSLCGVEMVLRSVPFSF